MATTQVLRARSPDMVTEVGEPAFSTLENRIMPPLRPCPFCGSMDLTKRLKDDESTWAIVCKQCRARGPDVPVSSKAAYVDTTECGYRWNERVADVEANVNADAKRTQGK